MQMESLFVTMIAPEESHYCSFCGRDIDPHGEHTVTAGEMYFCNMQCFDAALNEPTDDEDEHDEPSVDDLWST